MDPSLFAAIGGLVIGLVAGAAGCLPGVRRARPGAERRHVFLWSAAFTLALASFLAGVCLAPSHAMWLFGGPVLGIPVLAVYAVRRAAAEPSAAPDPGRM